MLLCVILFFHSHQMISSMFPIIKAFLGETSLFFVKKKRNEWQNALSSDIRSFNSSIFCIQAIYRLYIVPKKIRLLWFFRKLINDTKAKRQSFRKKLEELFPKLEKAKNVEREGIARSNIYGYIKLSENGNSFKEGMSTGRDRRLAKIFKVNHSTLCLIS